jgi:hypothetical protein
MRDYIEQKCVGAVNIDTSTHNILVSYRGMNFVVHFTDVSTKQEFGKSMIKLEGKVEGYGK